LTQAARRAGSFLGHWATLDYGLAYHKRAAECMSEDAAKWQPPR